MRTTKKLKLVSGNYDNQNVCVRKPGNQQRGSAQGHIQELSEIDRKYVKYKTYLEKYIFKLRCAI